MQTRDEVEDLHNCRVFISVCLSRVFISGYANTGKKFSIAFTKYFSKLIRQMKGNFLQLLDPKIFSRYTL